MPPLYLHGLLFASKYRRNTAHMSLKNKQLIERGLTLLKRRYLILSVHDTFLEQPSSQKRGRPYNLPSKIIDSLLYE